MPLPYDPEFAEAAAPLLQQLGNYPKPAVHDISSRRAALDAVAAANGMGLSPSIPDDMERIIHHADATDGHSVAIHHYRKKQPLGEPAAAAPAILHMHGGGFFTWSPDIYKDLIVSYVAGSGVQFLSVDYRLAPENRYPIPLEDCWAALQWLNSHAGDLSIDPSRIAVFGDSAGAGLAASLAILARDRGLSPPLAKQILLYPMLDDRTADKHAEGSPIWTVEDSITAWTAYIGDDIGGDRVSPYAAPARVESVGRLPSLYLDCGQLDVFAQESEDYARRFVAANISTELHVYTGLPHGFDAIAPSISASQKAMKNLLRAMGGF